MKQLVLKESSSIDSAWYDPEIAQLVVLFTSGAMYQYYQVKSEVVDRWVHESSTPAGSTGHWFYFNIRDLHDYKEVE